MSISGPQLYFTEGYGSTSVDHPMYDVNGSEQLVDSKFNKEERPKNVHKMI